MQAGKHCYIEKPLTHNLFEGKAIVAAVKKYGRIFQTGTQSRSTTNVSEAVEFVRSGGIGDVKFVRCLCYFRRKAIGPIGEYSVPPNIDYDLWCGPAEMKPPTRKNFHYDWHWQREYGNGDIGNQGVHKIDISAWLLGVDHFPQSVIAYGGRLGYENEMQNPDYRDAGDVANTQTVIYDYGDKSLVFEMRALETEIYGIPVGTKFGPLVGNIAYGTDGYVVQGGAKRGQSFSLSYAFDKNGQMIKEFKSDDGKGGMLSELGTTERHVANFLDAIVANDPKMLTADVHCGVLSAALCHLGNISYYLGEKNKVSVDTLKRTLQTVKSLDDNEATLTRMVEHLEANGVDLKKTPISLGPMLKIDVDKETFIGNPEADVWVTRDYRKPFVVPAAENV
jgi:predicted dehydrogenase